MNKMKQHMTSQLGLVMTVLLVAVGVPSSVGFLAHSMGYQGALVGVATLLLLMGAIPVYVYFKHPLHRS